ncbi:hypothetical protein H5410_040487 [Solanum commersonii]|uniref:Uncharacterized protein n=1 Tax=Solanum commersonii TaxID=4109 RepID=A0A9J5XQ88_SOLCO|nr:hypothetical protein H5410_040487 [Solanum commersonii]
MSHLLAADGKETPQSNKISSVTGRLVVRAAKSGEGPSAKICHLKCRFCPFRGWRVYLQEEYGTTIDAMSYIFDR